MPNNTAIDTSVLITILGLIAAVWAVVPSNTRLRFRLSMSWSDWIIAISVFLVIHYLIFENFFRSIGLYYSFGPWKWGLDKGSTVYLLLLGLGLYSIFRAQAPKLATRKFGTFELLANTLLLTKRYDELFMLIEPHLFKIFELSNHHPLLHRTTKNLSLTPKPNTERAAQPYLQKCESMIKNTFDSSLLKFRSKLPTQGNVAERAQNLLKGILNHPQFVAYLSVSHPHFCLRILAIPIVVRENFTELFMDAIVSESSSLLYSELRNNENLNGRYRLALPASNRILHFLFKDVTTAERLALYRPIGEVVCRYIDDDYNLIEAYNRPLGYYAELGKYRCPVHAGLKLFEIMIHEGIHQGIQDHLWLFYFTHFTDKILKKLRDQQPDDSNYEWPTPFHFLIYEIVTITSNWIDDCIESKEPLISEPTNKEQNFDSQYISKEATNALGSIIQSILLSPKIDDRFKGYMLEISLDRFKRLQKRKDTAPVARAFIKSIILGEELSTKQDYRRELHRIYERLDHTLRHDVESFGWALKQSLTE
ncbi:hypothetical protein C4K19_2495 [Pseudomonas chlororaphis subsp. aurantiaca]|uniref:hypothetical protein n=1 Tax=Pseudomonas chlororaphis TaxID=587753 RepID=UPI000F56B9BB|nr:hypothetical protein [Pseudomonas chlororaphis]AZD54282.1 hypothetical protein C4K19_2495 [Pseudomonas chlororaphis subsp. aurantiaca]